MKILYLVSRTAQDIRFETIIKNNSPIEIYIFPMEYGCEARISQISQYCEAKGWKVVVIKSLELLNQNSFKFKDQYIKWLYEVSEANIGSSKNLKEFFSFDKGTASVWWLSLINERNTYKSDSYIEYVKIMTMKELIQLYGITVLWFDRSWDNFYNVFKESSVKVSLKMLTSKTDHLKSSFKNSDLIIFIQEQIRSLWAFFYLIKRILQAKFYLKDFQKRVSHLNKINILAFTMFPLVDHAKIKENKFVNRAYGLIDKTFKDSPHMNVAWLAMFTEINQYKWVPSIKLGNQLNQHGEKILFYEEFINVKVFLRIIVHWLMTAFKTLIQLNRFSRIFVYQSDIGSISLWRLFKKDFYSSFAGKELLVELGMYFAFDEIVKNLPSHARLYHYAELHGWENSLNMICRKHPSLITVGLQHTIMPLLLLNYFRDAEDLKDKDLNGFPQPSYIGTTGEITRSLFLQNGWNQDKVFILGGFRFANILNLLKAKELDHDHLKKHQMVVALSISDKENAEILHLLNDSLKECDLDIKVFLKPHPCNNLPALIQKLGLKFNSRVEITNRSLDELVSESKVMIVKKSSSIFEALVRRVPVIVPQLYSMIDMCPLSGLCDGVNYVYSSKELLNKLNEMFTSKQSLFNQESIFNFLNRYLHPFNKEKILNPGLPMELSPVKTF